MDVFTSAACVTILCIIAISSAQGIQHATRSHVSSNTGFSGQMESSHHLEICGNMSYISSGNSCCNGKLTMGLSHLVADCCDSVAYNRLNEICCEGSIFIPSSTQVQCCGKELFLPTTHFCCDDKVILQKKNHACCGGKLYDMTTHVCCITPELLVKPKNESCTKHQTDKDNSLPTRTSPKVPEFKCGSETYDPKKEICCSGNLYRTSALTKCCGEHAYTPFDDHVLCCNGTLYRNVPKKSECVGGIVYAPSNTTCHLSTRPRLGEHCCGRQTYNPRTHICCNGHSHYRTDGTFCCGSKVYDHKNPFTRCCSGHLYNLTHLKRVPECCGNVLLEYNSNKKCCSSSTHAILYDTKTNHRCCGHYYYNTSLWRCCAEHLQPTPSHNSTHAENRLQPLMDLIPGICRKTVLFGKVESIALDTNHRHIVLKVVIVVKDPWLHVSLDHCSAPALEIGMTYLWEKTDNGYEPLSISVDPVSDIHMFYTVCHHHTCQKRE